MNVFLYKKSECENECELCAESVEVPYHFVKNYILSCCV